MSHIGAWALTRNCTIWPRIGRDVYGNPEFGAPVYLEKSIRPKVEVKTMTDTNGKEIVTMMTIRSRAEFSDYMKKGNWIAINGDFTNEADPIAVDGANEIKIDMSTSADPVGSTDPVKVFV